MRHHPAYFDGIIEFVESARSRSFTTAAAVLGVTNSAVGKSVSRLEARLGVKLMHRTTRRLTLTHEGRAYFESCLNIIDQMESVESGMMTGRAMPVGRLRLDLPGAFGRRHVLPVLTRLSNLHPRLNFSIVFSERTADLIAEGIDLAVRIGALGNREDFTARRLGTQRLVICASPGYLLRAGEPTAPEDLLSRDCIVGWPQAANPVWLLNAEGTASPRPIEIRARHAFSDGEAMVDAVLNGCGLCQLPTWLVSEHLNSGAIVTVLDPYAGAEMPIHAVWPRSRYMQPKLRVLIDALVEASPLDQAAFNT